MNDHVKRQALLVASAAKDQQKVDALPVKEAGSVDHERGPATIPGKLPGYGRNHNPVEPMPTQSTPEPGQ